MTASDVQHRVHVADDARLLATMIAGQEAAGYGLSSHWSSYQSETLAMINGLGLDDFLRIHNPFGNFPVEVARPPSVMARVGHRLRRKLRALRGLPPPPPPMVRSRATTWDERMDFVGSYFATALMNFDHGQRLKEIEDSLAGNPPATFKLFGKRCSFQFLTSFSRAQWLLRNTDIPHGATVVEIGGGYGAFVEVLRKLRPDLRIAQIDIVPQLYILEQRMRAIFPGAVAGYTETNGMSRIDMRALPEGAIAIVAPWDTHKLAGVDLGINFASMQEMTRPQAAGYVAEMDRAGATMFYLINYHPGVIGPPEVAVSSDFLVNEFAARGYQVVAFADKRGPGLYQAGQDAHDHDHLLFKR